MVKINTEDLKLQYAQQRDEQRLIQSLDIRKFNDCKSHSDNLVDFNDMRDMETKKYLIIDLPNWILREKMEEVRKAFVKQFNKPIRTSKRKL